MKITGDANENLIEHRSEEIQDIISAVPEWMIKWGMSLLFFVFVILLSFCWFLKYPDILKAKVVISTNPPPINLISGTSGHLELIKTENQVIKEGELIAYIRSSTDVKDLLLLEKKLVKIVFQDTIISIDANYKLGELQHTLNDLVSAEQALKIFIENDLQSKQIIGLERQLKSTKQLNSNIEVRCSLMRKESILSHEKFAMDSILFAQNVLSRADYNTSKGVYLKQQRDVKDLEADLLNNQMQYHQIDRQIQEFQSEKNSSFDRLTTNQNNLYKELLFQIKKWKESYLFISPMNGKLAQLEYLENGQYIESNKALFSIVPISHQIFGKAELPLAGSGKVKVGQSVNIRLTSYPYEQFGVLKGEVESISLLPSQDRYIIKLKLPNGMLSSYSKTLPFKQQLQGETEIITEDLSLLERIFYQFRKLINFR